VVVSCPIASLTTLPGDSRYSVTAGHLRQALAAYIGLAQVRVCALVFAQDRVAKVAFEAIGKQRLACAAFYALEARAVTLEQAALDRGPRVRLDLGAGDPDFALLPLDMLRHAAEACFAKDDPSFLQYGVEQGDGYFRMALAEFLHDHDKVNKVFYAGLASNPQFEINRVQFNGFSGMLAFEVRGGWEAAKTVMENLKTILFTVSLGDISSLISHPASTSHVYLSPEERAQIGVTEGLLRLSVGIEFIDDLKADLSQALAAI